MTIVLPAALAAMLAIVGLFVDRDRKSFRILAPFVGVLAAVVAAFQVYSGWEAEKYELRLERSVDELAGSTGKMSGYLSNVMLSQPNILKDFGISETRMGKALAQVSTEDLVDRQILAANRARAELVASRLPSAREGVRVWYYTKEVDTPIIRRTLEEIGFEVVNKVATQNQANDPTNAVWYGPGTDLDDYRTVLVNMIRAGIPILRTGAACNNTGAKTRVIEVGASDAAAEQFRQQLIDPIKVETVMGAASIDDLNMVTC